MAGEINHPKAVVMEVSNRAHTYIVGKWPAVSQAFWIDI